ncbi:DNA damage-binding protein 1a [Perkinsus chesapeaki]|uniref:DNA damage-binding protein 1a n=1 Tax=Perkinsus chesapeaki TaxID=330153 RepID=A0A7J6LWI6_PERCH|nr:DNA damage-binding protein 1a [Perkinsus chesapeaki]
MPSSSSPSPVSSPDEEMRASSSSTEASSPSGFYVSTLQPATAVVSARSILDGKYLVVARITERIQIFGPFIGDTILDGEEEEEETRRVMRDGPLLEFPVMARIVSMEVVQDNLIFFTTAKRQFGLWRFTAEPTNLEVIGSGKLSNLYPYPATDSSLRACHIVAYNDKTGLIAVHLFRGQLFVLDLNSTENSAPLAGQALRMDTVPEAIDMCFLPTEGDDRRITLAVLYSKEPLAYELEVAFFILDMDRKTLETAPLDTHPRIDVTNRGTQRILPLSYNELIAIGPRTVTRYMVNQPMDETDSPIVGEITTKNLGKVTVGLSKGDDKWFVVDEEGWLHVIKGGSSAPKDDVAPHFYTAEGNGGQSASGKRRRGSSTRKQTRGKSTRTVEAENRNRCGLDFDTLGPVSSGASSALAVLLDGRLIFVASDCGDAHRLCTVSSEAYTDTESFVKTIYAELSLSPIIDFQLRSGNQDELIMVTGRDESSYIRSMRLGLSLRELARVRCDAPADVWSISTPGSRPLLVQSFATTTVVYGFLTIEDDNRTELIPIDFTGKFVSAPSLWCGCVGGLAVQVTERTIRFIDAKSTPPVLVSSVDVENAEAFVTADGDKDILFTVSRKGKVFSHEVNTKTRAIRSEEVQLDRPALGASCMSYKTNSGVLAIGLWPSIGKINSKRTIVVKQMKGGAERELNVPSDSSKSGTLVPRSVVVCSAGELGLSGAPESVLILCGFDDGRLFIFSLDDTGSAQEINLGGVRPVMLSRLASVNGVLARGTNLHFVTADSSECEIVCKNVNPLEGNCHVECAVEFGDNELVASEEGSTALLALVTSEPSLAFASLTPDEPCEIHTRQKEIGNGQTGLHVEHVTKDLYAVSTITMSPRAAGEKENIATNGSVSSTSSVRLVIGSSLREVCVIPADEVDSGVDEASSIEVSSLATISADDSEDSGVAYLCVGSCVVPGTPEPPEVDESEPSKGFVKIYKVDPTAMLRGESDGRLCERVAIAEVEGVPYQIGMLKDANGRKFLLCTINNVLEVYAVERAADGDMRLGLVTKRHLHVASIFMQIQGSNVAVGDMTRGVSLLHFDSKVSAITELARYEFSMWPTALHFLSTGEILVTDDKMNLFMLGKQKDIGRNGSKEAFSLQTMSQFHLGLTVNSIKSGSIKPSISSNSAINREQYLICSTEGALVMLTCLDTSLDMARLLQIQHAIEININKQSPQSDARLDWRAYRSIDSNLIRSTVEPSGFIDGDLLQLFLVTEDDDDDIAVRAANTLNDGTTGDALKKEVEEVVEAFA